MKKKPLWIALIINGVLIGSGNAEAIEINTALRTAIGGQADGARDLGQGNLASNEVLYLNVSPRVSVELNKEWTFYFRGRAFLPTGDVLDSDETQTTLQRETKSFVKLDEAWLRYGGFTSYPGESVRLGHQIIRENDRSWLGRDLDAVYWVFNTTQLTSSAGVSHQFSAYRSDGIELQSELRDRIYGHANIATDWKPEHQIGFRAMHARDINGFPSTQEAVGSDPKLEEVNLTWLGLYLSNGYLNPKSPTSLQYWGDVTYLVGNTINASLSPNKFVSGFSKQEIAAVASTAAIRWRPFIVPIAFGAEYAYSGGGGKSQYRQSGLQGNAVQFTGITTSVYRYNEALRAQLGNLRVASVYASFTMPSDEFAVVAQKFEKDDKRVSIVTNNISAPTNNTSADVGYGVDFIASHFLTKGTLLTSQDDDGGDVNEDPRSAIRLRASLFNPGRAYAPGSDINYRVIVEATLWWF